jgi:hypothetical protein
MFMMPFIAIMDVFWPKQKALKERINWLALLWKIDFLRSYD